MLGLFMVLPVLVLYGDSYAGATPALLGLALGVYGLSQACLQIPFGLLSDRLGRKKMIAFGLLLFAAGSVLAAVSDSIYGLIAGRFLQGCGAIASVIMALVADLTSDEHRTKAMATIGASIGVSFSLALVLGPLVTAWGGLPAVFWVTAVLAVLGLVILFKVVPTPVVGQRHRDSQAIPELMRNIISNPQLLRLDFGIFVLHFVLMASFLVMPELLEQQLGIARVHHWWVYLPLLLLAFFAMVPFIIIAEKRRKIKPVLIAAVLLLGITELLLAFYQGTRFGWFVLLFLFFMAFNLLEATLPSLMSKTAPPGAKGTASGVYSTCQFLGAFGGGVCGGWLLQYHGMSAVMGVCAILVLAWLLAVVTMKTPKHLTALEVAINPATAGDAYDQLTALSGVEEVLIVEHEGAAYLKVDKRSFKRESLDALQLMP